MDIKLKVVGLSAAPSKKQLNSEWIEIHNEGEQPFNGEGCAITVVPKNAKGRPRMVTSLKAGLVIQPDEHVRLVSGSPGKKSQGDAPAEDDTRNYHLFLKVPYLDKKNLLVRFVNRQQVELCRVVHGG
ncbi:MAG: hypothetical protein JRH20_28560 [Deltaproteobacteria bacterium]|nr:hypothetical protein [Deltaproteobacteria bacterium]